MDQKNKPVTLRLEDNQPINGELLNSWTETVNAAGEVKKLLFDFSAIKKIADVEINAIARHFGPTAKQNEWQMMVMCTPAVEAIFEKLGLTGIFKCLQVHEKAEPVKNLFSPEINPSAVRREISEFFGHLVAIQERITAALFGVALLYTPPIALLTDFSEESSNEASGAIVRMESGSMNYRLVFLVSSADKQKLGTVAFKGREVNPAALNDLISELANNVMGDLVSQLGHSDPPVSLKSGIPESVTNEVLLSEDMSAMKGRVLLHFSGDDCRIKILVGYSLRC